MTSVQVQRAIAPRLVGIFALACACGAAQAATATYTSEASFLAALGAGGHLLNFDTNAAGAAISGSGAVIDTQYQAWGVTFNAFNGGVANTINFGGLAPQSAPNALRAVFGVGGGGGFEAVFSGGARGVGLYLGDLQPALGSTTLTVLDTANQTIASYDLGALLGDAPLAWRYFGVTSSVPIAKLQVANGANDFVEYDNLSFLAPVPEPASQVLMVLGLAALGLRARRPALFKAA